MVGTETKKGVSPVIASVLMVMIAIGLIAFTYTWFTGMARQAKATGTKQMGEMEKALQELKIGNAVYNTSGECICFTLRAPLTNSRNIPIKGFTHYYIDGKVVNLNFSKCNETKCSVLGINFNDTAGNCTIGGLDPGDECWGAIFYNETNVYPTFFEIRHDWGVHEVEVITYK